eukprot:CAMPEP_0172508330 /NCGR_PEP_ID=MMETSP1066-20121228/211143_1 /TAXON_ID=671091 /ORGANISM="Coscinodiscus wailesii, Strain CCMP2513" /LENGTH=106 /DNA_ID=CAMNT_0013286263 /DNA_START=307 /DNA_END=627 /DNA_ORIENTATION=-
MNSFQFLFTFRLKGLQEKCDKCGIHVHEGTSCDRPTGQHYWAANDDPWVKGMGAYYNVLMFGESTGEFVMNDGYAVSEHRRRTVTIHAQDGTRIACGVLRPRERDC